MVFISKLLVVFMASEFVRAQTLYHVGSEIGQITTEALSQSVSVSAAGVGADGATTYVEDILESYIAIEYSDTTVTLLTTPIAYTVTFVADASGYHESFQFGMEGQAFETCGFGADGHGTCVEELLLVSDTDTRTFSGTAVPFYTLAAATPTSTSIPAAPNRAALLAALPGRAIFSALALVLTLL